MTPSITCNRTGLATKGMLLVRFLKIFNIESQSKDTPKGKKRKKTKKETKSAKGEFKGIWVGGEPEPSWRHRQVFQNNQWKVCRPLRPETRLANSFETGWPGAERSLDSLLLGL